MKVDGRESPLLPRPAPRPAEGETPTGEPARAGIIYAIANQKGGVGKTTTAINLCASLSALGRRVLLVDIDPQANATSGYGLDKSAVNPSVYDVIVDGLAATKALIRQHRPGLDVLPASLSLAGAEVELVALPAREQRLARGLRPLAPQYDHIIIDCPPSLGLLTVSALTAAQRVIVPVQCEYLALEGLTQLMRSIALVRQSLNPRLRLGGVLLTMFDSRTNLSQQVVDEVRRHFPQVVFTTVVPRSVRLSEAPSHGRSILEYDPASRGAAAYRELAEELVAREESTNVVGGRV
ncbi:MAG: ParA family protein [Chloroflexota bacterium]